MRKTGFLVLLFLAFTFHSNAQVAYKIEWLKNIQAYQVLLVPSVTWTAPSNITSSAHVVLKAPANGMEVQNLGSRIGGVDWKLADNIERAGYRYFLFQLVNEGTDKIPFRYGEEVPLFTFQNAAECRGPVELANNQHDEIFQNGYSKTRDFENQLTVLGAGGDAFTGIVGTGKAGCGHKEMNTSGFSQKTEFRVAPPTANGKVKVSFDWSDAAADCTIRAFTSGGEQVASEYFNLKKGANLLKLSTDHCPAGLVFLELEAGGKVRYVGKFVKQ